MAKVVAAAWWTELIEFFAVVAILHQDGKNRMNYSNSSNHPGAKFK